MQKGLYYPLNHHNSNNLAASYDYFNSLAVLIIITIKFMAPNRIFQNQDLATRILSN